jgi:hypothetical protein
MGVGARVALLSGLGARRADVRKFAADVARTWIKGKARARVRRFRLDQASARRADQPFRAKLPVFSQPPQPFVKPDRIHQADPRHTRIIRTNF